MKQEKMYRYVGKNGVITSLVLLENISHIPVLRIWSEEGKILTNGNRKVYSTVILPEELSDWSEIADELDK